MRTAAVLVLYYVSLIAGVFAVSLWLIWLDRHGRSARTSPQHAAQATARCAKDCSVSVGRLDEYRFAADDWVRETEADSVDALWLKVADEGAVLRLGDLR